METLFNPITLFAVSILVLVYSSVLHEIAHGYIAYRFGDPTAKLLGRLTLNPIKHIDPYMSVLLPLLLIVVGSPVIFGGAKPVPVDPFNLRDGRKDLALVSLAGPLTNLLLVVAGTIIFKLFFPEYIPYFGNLIYHAFHILTIKDLLAFIFSQVVFLNLILAIFNLIPIPPLDGSKVFALLLPGREAAAYMSLGNIGMLILMVLLFFPFGGFSLMGIVSNLITSALSILGL